MIFDDCRLKSDAVVEMRLRKLGMWEAYEGIYTSLLTGPDMFIVTSGFSGVGTGNQPSLDSNRKSLQSQLLSIGSPDSPGFFLLVMGLTKERQGPTVHIELLYRDIGKIQDSVASSKNIERIISNLGWEYLLLKDPLL